jgi:RHS repeat-associated protein
VLVETSGSSTAYLYGHDGCLAVSDAMLTTSLLAKESTAWAWHLNDGLGSVRQLADSAGDVTLAQGYTPFGVLLWSEGSGASAYGFTGEQWDAEVELLYLRARYYEPEVGRFMQRDVWQGDHLRPQSLHPYVYVQNNAINYLDPSGKKREKPWDGEGDNEYWEWRDPTDRELADINLDESWTESRKGRCCAQVDPCNPELCIDLPRAGAEISTKHRSFSNADEYMRYWLAWEYMANPCHYRLHANCLGAALEVSGLYTGKDFSSHINDTDGYSSPETDWPEARDHFRHALIYIGGKPGDLYRTSLNLIRLDIDAHFAVRTAHSSSDGGTLYFHKMGPKGYYELEPLSGVPRWRFVKHYKPKK